MLIILAVVLLLVLPDPWNLVGFIAVTILWFGELFLWSRKVRSKPLKTGAQTLVGREGTVVEACRPDGQVRLNGELWAARCAAGASIGDTVRVTAIHGLTAVVEPVS
jgi:membrane protein implicated in regulation of membrane protease activity